LSTPPGPKPYPSEFGGAWGPSRQPLPPSGTGQPQYQQAPDYGEPQYYQQAPEFGRPPQYYDPEPGYGQRQYYRQERGYEQPQYYQQAPESGQAPQYYQQAPGNGQPPGAGRIPPQGPPGKRRTGVVIGVCAAVVVALVALGAGFNAVKSRLGLTSPSPGASPAGPVTPRSLTRPASAAGYARLTGNAGQRLETEVRQRAQHGAAKVSPAWARAFRNAQIGLYSEPGGGSRLIFFGFSARGTPAIASILRSQPPSAGLDSFFLGAGVKHTHGFRAGLLGGVLRCGVSNQGQVPLTMCAWDDSSVLAALAGASISERELARVTLEFRNASEH
jgi:hypothetical protein